MQKVLFNKTYEEYIGGNADTQLTLGDDTKPGSFHAHVKMSFWQENQITWEMPGVEGEAVHKGNVCECDTPECKHEWFQHTCDYYGTGTNAESQLKWILTLKSEPASNIYKMKLGGDWNDFEYLYQPPFPSPTSFMRNGEEWLLQDMPEDPTTIEIRRPACMDGGYAVYHKSKCNHKVGGKNYRTGKVGNFHRPRATDAIGASVWCLINITGSDYTVTIPQDFLDNAVYPVRVNDTFGLTSKGATDPVHPADWLVGARGYLAPSNSGTANSVHIWTRQGSGDTMNCAIYPPGSSTSKIANSQTDEVASPTEGAFQAFSFVSGNPAITASTDYAIAFWCDGSLEYAYDAVGGEGQYYSGGTYASTIPDPVNWTDITYDRRYSAYVDFTPVSADTEIYSRGDILDLPSGIADLETVFGSGSYAAVESDDANRVAQAATGEFTAFVFKDKLIDQENIRVTWNGKTDLAPSSQTIYLQIYNRTTRFWETVDSDNTSAVNTDFTLTYDLTANLDDYFDSGNWIAARVYQEAA